MSKFLQIRAIQPPIDIGIDPSNRSMFSTNYRASVIVNSNQIERDILSHLQSKGLCLTFDNNGNLLTSGATGFYGSKAVIPSGNGPYILVKLTGGYISDINHDNSKSTNVTFQIAVWASSHDACMSRSWNIHNELDGRFDIEI